MAGVKSLKAILLSKIISLAEGFFARNPFLLFSPDFRFKIPKLTLY